MYNKCMLKLSFLLSIFFTQSLCAQILVTGFDDNLRQSENISTLGSLERFILKPDESYSGMTLLYSLMQKRNSSGKIYVLTGMPSLFRARAEKFLQSINMPPHELIMRNIFKDWPTSEFKMKHIDMWMRRYEHIILVKDNSDVSLELAQQVADNYGPRLLKFYSRETSKRFLPAFATPYVTPIDIAIPELLAGRLSRGDVEKLLQHLLSEIDTDKIIPSWSFGPPRYNPCPPDILPQCPYFAHKVQQICKQRKE